MGELEAEETSGRNLDVVGGILEASGRHLGNIWQASGKHLGGIWEASGRHLGLQEAMGLQETWEAIIAIPLS